LWRADEAEASLTVYGESGGCIRELRMVDDAPEDLPPRVVETRTSPRQRSLLSGKVASRDGAMTVTCTIKDISETGARITVPGGLFLPQHIFLIHSRSPLVFEAEVSWMKAPQFGLRFIRTLSREDLIPDLKFLMRLYA